MANVRAFVVGAAFVAGLLLLGGVPKPAIAASAVQIDADVDAALARLYREVPSAADLAERAAGVLVFPSVVKGGLMVGGQYGNGALRQHGRTTGYYQTAAVSYGFQAGAQTFSYALFFMSEGALGYLDESGGWEIGTGPSLVVLDDGMAQSFSSTTIQHDIYAFVFGQQGLMAGAGLQGSKISRIDPRE